jgi:8-oxo-dGTP pyrophosphatase MutT (NUDIX family)
MDSWPPERDTSTAGVMVLKYIDGELRIAMARDPEKGPDAWVIPKGHVRDGETIETAALREAAEETGASNILLITYLGAFDRCSLEDWGEWVHKTVHLYLGCSFGPVAIHPAAFETLTESAWLPVEQVVEKVAWREDRDFVRQQFNPWLSQTQLSGA